MITCVFKGGDLTPGRREDMRSLETEEAKSGAGVINWLEGGRRDQGQRDAGKSV